MPDTATLRSMIASLYPDNGLQEITASRLRQGLRYIADLLDVSNQEGGRTTFRNLAELLATDETFPVGEILVTEAEGFAYEAVVGGGHLTTASGTMLRVLPGQGWTYDIRAFGARTESGFDNGPSITAAINAAGLVQNGTVIIPAGEFETRTAIDASMGACRGLTIQGQGPKTSIIKGIQDTFHTLLKVTRTLKGQLLVVQGIGLLCDNNGLTVNQQRYAGLYYTSTIGLNPDGTAPAGYGFGKRRNFIARDIYVGGYDQNSPFRGRFQNGIVIEHGRWPLIDNPSVDTASPWDNRENFPDTYIEGSGVLFKDCYYGAILEPRIAGRWRNGVKFVGYQDAIGDTQHADFEGAIVSGGEIVGYPEVGVGIDHLGRDEDVRMLKEPGMFVSRSHIHAHKVGVQVRHHAVVTILDCNIATTDFLSGSRRQNERHIELHDVHSAIIDHCQFWGDGYDNGDDDCTRGVVVQDKVTHVSINNCHFMHEGIGVLVESGDTLNFKVGDGNVWGGRKGGADVYQVRRPRVRVQKRFALAEVMVPRMHDAAVYDGQVSAKTFEKGQGYWMQAVGANVGLITTIPGGAMPAGYTHAMLLTSDGFEGRWIADPLPQGATWKITAKFRNAANPYAVTMGVQARSAAGTVVNKLKAAAAAGAAGWTTVSLIVSATGDEVEGGWRPTIQMTGIGGNNDAVCQVVYFSIELVQRANEAFLPAATGAAPISNGEMTFERVSNTSLKVNLRGTDGVVRSATLTLS